MTNWVFIRGLARQKPHWNGFPDLVKARFGGMVHCLDLPGIGGKAHLTSPLRIREYSQNLHEEFLSLKARDGNDGTWTLVAVSLGGMIGLDWTARFPSDFQNLITINTSAGNLSPLTKRLRPEALGMILRLFWNHDVRTRERAILQLTTNLIEITEERVDRWVSYDRERPLTRSMFLRQILAAASFRMPPSLPVRPLILASEKDRLAHPQCSRDLATFLKAQIAVHPEAGHDLALDDPEWTLRRIESFISARK